MIVLNSIDGIVTVYTFRNDQVVSLDYGDIDLLALLHGAARTSLGAAPENMTGFVFMWRGPSAGSFGTSAFYRRVVIDGYKLVIADYGEWFIDVNALHELFDDFGRGADWDELDAAIQKHTHLSINGIPVYEEELDRVFGLHGPRAFSRRHAVDFNSIEDVIFGWSSEINISK